MHPCIDPYFVVCIHAAFGFNQSTFRAVERGESYAIDIGFLSGTVLDPVFGMIELNLKGTASKNGSLNNNYYL